AALDAHAEGVAGWRFHAGSQLLRALSIALHASDPRRSRLADLSPRVNRGLDLALAFLERNLARDVLVAEVAAAANLSGDYFPRLFRRRFDVSPMQHLMHLRLQEARRLLAGDPALAIEAAARAVGFDQPGYFSRLFRRHFGVTPGEFRLRLQPPLRGRRRGD
ncbi:MAG: helix-turn-helix transcriptional regulator, partial [Planctomycetes bacterium]|nr:helix-turn-helix transcriptional regulator [Planctomycetota bacterium]